MNDALTTEKRHRFFQRIEFAFQEESCEVSISGKFTYHNSVAWQKAQESINNQLSTSKKTSAQALMEDVQEVHSVVLEKSTFDF